MPSIVRNAAFVFSLMKSFVVCFQNGRLVQQYVTTFPVYRGYSSSIPLKLNRYEQ
jgi:hypothetical protein